MVCLKLHWISAYLMSIKLISLVMFECWNFQSCPYFHLYLLSASYNSFLGISFRFQAVGLIWQYFCPHREVQWDVLLLLSPYRSQPPSGPTLVFMPLCMPFHCTRVGLCDESRQPRWWCDMAETRVQKCVFWVVLGALLDHFFGETVCHFMSNPREKLTW